MYQFLYRFHTNRYAISVNKICFGLVLTLMLTSIYTDAGYAKSRQTNGVCEPEKRPLGMPSDGESDAVCSYDFAEFNWRLANLIEMPAGEFTLDYMQKLLSMPAMRQRPDLGYRRSYKEAGYSIALAGKGVGRRSSTSISAKVI